MKRLPVALKSLLSICVGFIGSLVLYPFTHGRRRQLPELYGIGFGCVLIAFVHYWLYGDDEETAKLFYAMSLVGLGVALNRARLEVKHA